MPAPLTIIIPTLNAQASLPASLNALMEALPNALLAEVIIADGGSTDATLKIADDWGGRIVRTDKGRGRQLHAGADKAKGTWLLFIHADTCLSADWSAAVIQHISDKTNHNRAGYGRLRFDVGGIRPRFVAGWANLRSAVFALPYGDQTLLISRDYYHEIGGYPQISLMEDVAIARKIGRNYTRLEFNAITRADKFTNEGWLKRGTKNLATLVLYFIGIDVEILARWYKNQP